MLIKSGLKNEAYEKPFRNRDTNNSPGPRESGETELNVKHPHIRDLGLELRTRVWKNMPLSSTT